MKKLFLFLLLTLGLSAQVASNGSFVSGGQVTPAAPSGGSAEFSDVKVDDGTVGAPSYSFILDPDTGFYRDGSGDVGFSSDGTRTFGFPLTTGSSGQLLTTDGSGNITWVTATGGAGDFNGPASSTDNAIVRFDGTSGKIGQNSLVSITDTGNINTPGFVVSSNPISVPARILSDGSTSNLAIRAQFGAVGDVAGSSMTLEIDQLDVPASNPSVEIYLAVLSSVSASGNFAVRPNTLIVSLTTAGSLRIQEQGVLGSSYLRFLYSGFRAAYSGLRGQRLTIVWPSGASTTDPTVHLNGVDISSGFASTTNGTPPNWLDAGLSTTNFLSGYIWPVGDVPIARIVNGAYSDTEAVEWSRGGNRPAWAEQPGSCIEQTSGSLILGAKYRITTAGGTFTGVGAADNNVDTKFIATGTTPTWSTGGVVIEALIDDPIIEVAGTRDRLGRFDRTYVGMAGISYHSTRDGLGLAATDSVTFAEVTTTGSVTVGGNLTPSGRLVLPMGEINYFSLTGTSVPIVSTSTTGIDNAVKIAPVTALTSGAYEFDNGGADNGRLRYTGTTTRMFHFACSVSFGGANNDTFTIMFAKNGTVVSTSTIATRKMGTGGDTGSTARHGMIELATNDYVEAWIANNTDTDNPTVYGLNLFALGH